MFHCLHLYFANISLSFLHMYFEFYMKINKEMIRSLIVKGPFFFFILNAADNANLFCGAV